MPHLLDASLGIIGLRFLLKRESERLPQVAAS